MQQFMQVKLYARYWAGGLSNLPWFPSSCCIADQSVISRSGRSHVSLRQPPMFSDQNAQSFDSFCLSTILRLVWWVRWLQQQALRIREQVLGPDHPDVAVSLTNTGELYRSQGMFAEAEPLFKVRNWETHLHSGSRGFKVTSSACQQSAARSSNHLESDDVFAIQHLVGKVSRSRIPPVTLLDGTTR